MAESRAFSRKNVVVPLKIREFAGVDRLDEPVTVGVPFPKGLLSDLDGMFLVEDQGIEIPWQSEVLSRWSDLSIRWLLLDFRATMPSGEKREFIPFVRILIKLGVPRVLRFLFRRGRRAVEWIPEKGFSRSALSPVHLFDGYNLPIPMIKCCLLNAVQS